LWRKDAGERLGLIDKSRVKIRKNVFQQLLGWRIAQDFRRGLCANRCLIGH
jgi:hypothetical protein